MQRLLKLQVLALVAAQHLACCCATTPGICCFATASRLDAIADTKPPTGSQPQPFAGLLFLLQRAASILLLEQTSLVHIVTL